MAQSLRDIKDRMSSLEGSHKIVKAMKIIATGNLRPAERSLLAAKDYAISLHHMIRSISEHLGRGAPPLMRRHGELKNFDVVVISSDQGLCGGFNENLMRNVLEGYEEHVSHGINMKLLVAGRRGIGYLKQRGIDYIELPVRLKDPSFARMVSVEIAQLMCERFLSRECDGSFIAFNSYINTQVQKTTFWNLLPLHWRGHERKYQYYIYEPERDELLNRICRLALEYTIMQAILESNTAEQAARITAMDAASRNAKAVDDELKLIYNRARQEAITSELIDIINGSSVQLSIN
ncbi:MAG: ATP synthase F1 subunit gamma [Pseudomonadota bacterium]